MGTKQLTFFFSFERPRRLKACCGLIKPFGEGNACEIVETESETDWENSEMEKQVSESVSDLDQCVRVRR